MSSRAAQTTAAPIDAATALVGRSVFEALSEAAHQAGVALPEYVTELISMRATQELLAPSTIWLAIPAKAEPIRLALTEETLTVVSQLCNVCGHRQDVVLSNLATGSPPTSGLELPLGFLRTDPGKGRIFGMHFEIAGFQYALLRHLAGDTFAIGQILDTAFIALARQAASTGLLNDRPISQTARQFASKMVMIENRRRANGAH